MMDGETDIVEGGDIMWTGKRAEWKTPGIVIAVTALLLGAYGNVAAQSAEPLATRPDGAGARAIALGEAYYALGGDYYSLYYNPAGIGLARGIRLDGGLSHRTTTVSTRYYGTPSTIDVGSTGLDALGLTYALPTEQGNLVFAAGAHRVRDLDTRYQVRGFNTSDDPLIGETDVWSRNTDRGALYAYALGISVEASQGFFFGASVEALSGSNSYNYVLDASDTDDLWQDWKGILREDGIEYTYRSRGLRLGLGGLWRPNGVLSIGGSVRLPARVKITEDWFESDITYYDDDTSEVTWEDSGVFTYDFELPFEFGVGGALSLGALTIAGGGSRVDYTQAEYSKAPYDGFDPDFFANNYKALWQWGGGVELTTPSGHALRAGYQWAPLQFQPLGQQITQNREVYSLGVGVPFDRSLRMDVAYRYAKWDLLTAETRERFKNGQFLISFGYRF